MRTKHFKVAHELAKGKLHHGRVGTVKTVLLSKFACKLPSCICLCLIMLNLVKTNIKYVVIHVIITYYFIICDSKGKCFLFCAIYYLLERK